jgi:5-formyltetrahydrofolate cyclo-ligase
VQVQGTRWTQSLRERNCSETARLRRGTPVVRLIETLTDAGKLVYLTVCRRGALKVACRLSFATA